MGGMPTVNPQHAALQSALQSAEPDIPMRQPMAEMDLQEPTGQYDEFAPGLGDETQALNEVDPSYGFGDDPSRFAGDEQLSMPVDMDQRGIDPTLNPYTETNPMEAQGMAMDPMGGSMDSLAPMDESAMMMSSRPAYGDPMQSPYTPDPQGLAFEQQGVPQPGSPEFYDWLMSKVG